MLPTPKRLNQKQSHSHRRAPVQERETANRIGGDTLWRSGAGRFQKGDVRVRGMIRLDNKTTKAKSFRVTKDMIEKLEGPALMASEAPVFEIEIDNEGEPRKCYVIPTWALDSLIQEARERDAAEQT